MRMVLGKRIDEVEAMGSYVTNTRVNDKFRPDKNQNLDLDKQSLLHCSIIEEHTT